MEEAGTNKGYGKRPMWQWAIIYLVIAVLLYAAFYYFFLSNSSNPSYNTQTAVPSSTSEAVIAKEMTVNLATENDSGESGTAMLKEENSKTTVTLNLTGYAKDVPQPAHIHVGACPGVGAVKYPLNDVLNGVSVTTLNVTMDQLKKDLPLAINVHKSAKDITVYTSCGDLSSE